ncbi:hypothetical protein QMK33_11350 [Hymenobacter sp. H14-R3]|uniref:hypothetical protein n=1 Tax=Hymenobacter sp. H14-R3 TaxID=3046308 RepID=UPI0024B99C7B|nr:hypothetical protein [Hymenobacter sp. H14-R3]MDJ0365749.1 hypothetical protein [Hymenobacter sp. H14-R3]
MGDEVGYQLTAPLLATLPCESGYRLRRIGTRQLTADSLLLTYKEQDQVTTTAAPGCFSTPGTVMSTIRQDRWAFSLRTGASPQWIMGLLAGEYRAVPGKASALFMGRGYDLQKGSGLCLNDLKPFTFSQVYGASRQYLPGIDYLAVNQTFSALLGVGPTYFTDYYANYLAYYCRGATSCGQPLYFAGLLPSRAAKAAAAATLAPNPAAEAATLTLATPCPAPRWPSPMRRAAACGASR